MGEQSFWPSYDFCMFNIFYMAEYLNKKRLYRTLIEAHFSMDARGGCPDFHASES